LTHQREGYGLDLERFRTAAAMLNMIVQVRGKVYMTPTDVGDLVVALDDLFRGPVVADADSTCRPVPLVNGTATPVSPLRTLTPKGKFHRQASHVPGGL
jgi:hypothetical protein